MSTRSTTGEGLAPRRSPQWGWVAASGVVGILIGVLALFFPGVTILSAALFLGIGLVVQGIVEIAAAIGAGAGAAGRGWLVAFGVLALAAGVLVLFVPGSGVLVLVWGLILWFTVAGVNDLVAAASIREHRGWNIAMGIISLLAALVLLFSPGTAVGVIALIIALGFILRGGAAVGLALAMRRSAP
jgi:uncharacterized membrane protein HdeD (DUF308 family)